MKEKKWKMEKFTKIGQMRGIIQAVQRELSFGGYDENEEPIWNDVPLGGYPTLKFKGTVKTHGTNAGIGLTTDGEVYAMSRNNIITPLGDNAGFATWVQSEKEMLKKTLECAQILANQFHDDCKAYVYGEWIGKGVQNKVGISTLSKRWCIYAIKVVPNDTEVESFYIDSSPLVSCAARKIHKVEEFKTFEIDIDFNNVAVAAEQIEKWVLEVEAECPVAKALGAVPIKADGRLIGEGIVWTYFENRIRKHIFKTKGQEHSKGGGKVKKFKAADSKELQKAQLWVMKYGCTESRLDQKYVEAFGCDGPGDRKRTGEYIKSVFQDVVDEELDLLIEEGLEPKNISGLVAKAAKDYLFSRMNKEVGL